MDSHDIGKIIKNARLSKKMTQNEVVGNFITRNMLSQIESGSAMPSVKTLEYLCNVLDIQLEALADNDSADFSSARSDYMKLRKDFKDGNFTAVTDSPDIEEFSDECAALKASAYLKSAQKLSASDKVSDNQKAVEFAKKAEKLSHEGIFANKSTAESANETLKIAAVKLSKYYSDMI